MVNGGAVAAQLLGCDDAKPSADDRNKVRQLVRYALVGITSNALAFGVYLVLTAYGTPPTVAATVVYVTAASFGFVGHKRVTFSHRGGVRSAGAKYVVAHSIGYLLNLGILIVFVDRLGYSHVWVQAVAIVTVAVYLFLAFKFIVFPQSSSESYL